MTCYIINHYLYLEMLCQNTKTNVIFYCGLRFRFNFQKRKIVTRKSLSDFFRNIFLFCFFYSQFFFQLKSVKLISNKQDKGSPAAQTGSTHNLSSPGPPALHPASPITTQQPIKQQLYSISSSLILPNSDMDLYYICAVSTRRNRKRETFRKRDYTSIHPVEHFHQIFTGDSI